MENLSRALDLIAGSVESSNSSVFTFAVKETLNAQERAVLASSLRTLAREQSRTVPEKTTSQNISDFEQATRMGGKPQSSSASRAQ